MGPVRRGLSLLLLAPAPAWAEVCGTERPGWDGSPVSMVGEAVTLILSPLGIILLVATLLALRTRSQWGGVAVVIGWTGFATILTVADPTGLRDLARAEGCVGSPTLFIALAAAISVATILYTAPRKREGG